MVDKATELDHGSLMMGLVQFPCHHRTPAPGSRFFLSSMVDTEAIPRTTLPNDAGQLLDIYLGFRPIFGWLKKRAECFPCRRSISMIMKGVEKTVASERPPRVIVMLGSTNTTIRLGLGF